MRSSTGICALAILLGTVLPESVNGLENGLARTPPMGWLSWERFLCNVDCKKDPDNCISERLYKTMADILKSEGYVDAGYEYVNIDDCWMANKRDMDDRLQPNSTRFPGGIKDLAYHVHSNGLKLGIYQDVGWKTCAGYPGSLGYFDIDAQTFAEWGVDMLKLDGCYAEPKAMDSLYPNVTRALNETGRPIVFSCSWPAYQVEKGMKPDYRSIARHCNMWRNFDDIADSWASVTSVIDYYALVQDSLVAASGPGAWSDPDMLMIGNYGLSLEQSKAQMALWAILAAPLFMSNDLRTIRKEHKEILTNADVIAVNQDPLGRMGKRVFNEKKIEVWVRSVSPLSADGSSSAAIVFFNRRDMGGPVNVSVVLSSLGLNYHSGYSFTDLFSRNPNASFFLRPEDSLHAYVYPSGVVMYKGVPRGL